MILVIGTLAFDEIVKTDDLLPADNVKLTGWHRQFGGCGGNLAYTLGRLGHAHQLSGYLGRADGAPYLQHLKKAGGGIEGLKLVADSHSARAFIATDPTGHQFTAFQPLEVPIETFVSDLDALIEFSCPEVAMIAPDVPARMLAAADRFQGRSRLVCYPGQYTRHIKPAELNALFSVADLIFQNRIEHQAHPVPGSCMTVITAGADPVRIKTANGEVVVPVPEAKVVDPTGCGDAFAAAFTSAWATGAPLEVAAIRGIAWAQRCLAVHGSQSH